MSQKYSKFSVEVSDVDCSKAYILIPRHGLVTSGVGIPAVVYGGNSKATAPINFFYFAWLMTPLKGHFLGSRV